MTTSSAAFLDSSIQIARFVHSAETKQKIKERLARYTLTITGEVVKQEFKRRLLQEAKYLLGVLEKRGSFQGMYQQVLRLSHPRQQRKRNICLQMIGQVFATAGDPELSERLKLYLHYLITLGLDDFDESVGHIRKDSGCACARIPIQEKKRFSRYEFGTDKCSETAPGQCGIVQFLKDNAAQLQSILSKLQSLPTETKSAELKQAEEFIKQVLKNNVPADTLDPCYRVGDLIIALESIGIPVFYTFNGKESQHLCRALNQTLVVRKQNPELDDVECLDTNPNWPSF